MATLDDEHKFCYTWEFGMPSCVSLRDASSGLCGWASSSAPLSAFLILSEDALSFPQSSAYSSSLLVTEICNMKPSDVCTEKHLSHWGESCLLKSFCMPLNPTFNIILSYIFYTVVMSCCSVWRCGNYLSHWWKKMFFPQKFFYAIKSWFQHPFIIHTLTPQQCYVVWYGSVVTVLSKNSLPF